MPTRRLFLTTLLSLSGSLPGCAFIRNMTGHPAPALPPVLADDATLEAIVVHLNQNTEKLRSWRTTRARISSRGAAGIPISVDATIAVEAPRNFRLVAHSMVGSEVDLGSNQDQFWFWNRRNEEKCVFTARHDQDTGRMQRFPIPFQPDWIMEVMGVIPIDVGNVKKMERGPPGSHTVSFWEDRRSPQGYLVRKATLVDLQAGVIREHALYNSHGPRIARAVVSSYTQGRTNAGVPSEAPLVPGRIVLEWPEAQLELTMTLADPEINPQHFSPGTWALPEMPGYSVWDLTR